MILNINKPLNWTSFDVVKKVRATLNIKKVGHAGTLDPLATGVLIVLTDKDTKIQSEIMKLDKVYIADVAFGGTTPTYDMEFPVTFSQIAVTQDIVKHKLNDEINNFIGLVSQKAPAYSAKKVNGERLYKKARKGTISDIDIPTKDVHIYGLEILSSRLEEFVNKNGETKQLPVLKIKVACSSGTYVRSLAYDLGEKLGYGGFLSSLERIAIGNYKIEDSIGIDHLIDIKR